MVSKEASVALTAALTAETGAVYTTVRDTAVSRRATSDSSVARPGNVSRKRSNCSACLRMWT